MEDRLSRHHLLELRERLACPAEDETVDLSAAQLVVLTGSLMVVDLDAQMN